MIDDRQPPGGIGITRTPAAPVTKVWHCQGCGRDEAGGQELPPGWKYIEWPTQDDPGDMVDLLFCFGCPP